MTPAQLSRLADLPAFPATARGLIAVAGLAAAARLIREWPGLEFPVPLIPGGGNAEGARRWAQLVEVVGEAPAAQIVCHYGGGCLYIPSCKQAMAQWSRDFARHEYDRLTGDGYSHRAAIGEIALRVRIAGRTLERWLYQPDHAPQIMQGELF
ncbi:MAG: hypothetical protein LBI92_06800 [Azoarcus sp.]|jgi:hypothetical protein|nr:hypothetical protein [Azoarcus sp.]